MNLNGLIDCHTHTHFSPDSDEAPENMINKAISLGLSAYAVTDHCECNRWYSMEHYGAHENGYDTWNFDQNFERSVSCITEMKEKYSGKLNLICGVELGQATHDFEVAEKVVSDKRLDFVIGSMHQLPNNDDFAFIKYENYDYYGIMSLIEDYYNELLALCRWGKFDILGHVTYTLRYIEGDAGIKVDMKRFEETIRECFKEVVRHGKGIEINTSGLRQKYGKPFPDLEILKIYKEVGGEILSLGSDAHCAEDLGKGIKECSELAKQAGFRHIAYFKNRQPNFIKL